MNEREIWEASERIDLLFSLLDERTQRRRANSFLKSVATNYQDYLTAPIDPDDAQAVAAARNILAIYRFDASARTLYGRPIDRNVANSTFFREVERLFSNSERNFEGAEFSLYVAAHLTRSLTTPVTFVPERTRGGQAPDLRVGDVCYVECKDLAPTSIEALSQGMTERLSEAGDQLAAESQRHPLDAGGVAVDLPLALFQASGERIAPTDPAAIAAMEVAALTLSTPGPVDFILLSVSGFRTQERIAGAPVWHVLLAREALPEHVFELALDPLAAVTYLAGSDGRITMRDRRRFRRIQERAYFNSLADPARSPTSNWLAAESADDALA